MYQDQTISSHTNLSLRQKQLRHLSNFCTTCLSGNVGCANLNVHHVNSYISVRSVSRSGSSSSRNFLAWYLHLTLKEILPVKFAESHNKHLLQIMVWCNKSPFGKHFHTCSTNVVAHAVSVKFFLVRFLTKITVIRWVNNDLDICVPRQRGARHVGNADCV